MHSYIRHAHDASQWIVSKLNDDGSLGPEAEDLYAHYKAPYLLSLTGYVTEAHRVLNHIQRTFKRDNGDYLSIEMGKGSNPCLSEFWGYANGWIAMAAHKLGRFDVSLPAWEYLKTFLHPQLKGFTAHQPFETGQEVTDLIFTAQMGYLALYMGDLELARGAGRYLRDVLEKQPNLDKGLYVRQDGLGDPVTRYAEDAAFLHHISPFEPQQAYFILGHAMAFLSALYQATGRKNHLDTAIQYGEFALGCQGIDSFAFSHKVMWGAASLAKVTGDVRFHELSDRTGTYLESIQTQEGRWHPDEDLQTQIDQTAEIAVYFIETRAIHHSCQRALASV